MAEPAEEYFRRLFKFNKCHKHNKGKKSSGFENFFSTFVYESEPHNIAFSNTFNRVFNLKFNSHY
jgi:hypothetical protein